MPLASEGGIGEELASVLRGRNPFRLGRRSDGTLEEKRVSPHERRRTCGRGAMRFNVFLAGRLGGRKKGEKRQGPKTWGERGEAYGEKRQKWVFRSAGFTIEEMRAISGGEEGAGNLVSLTADLGGGNPCPSRKGGGRFHTSSKNTGKRTRGFTKKERGEVNGRGEFH